VIGYIGRAWRGEQNVAWSLLVNVICGYFAAMVVVLLVSLVPGVPHEGQGMLVLLIPWGAVVVWALVGTVRAAIATFRDPQTNGSLKMISVLVLAALAAIVVALSRDLAILSHGFLWW
jgi:hypothetical protein